MEQREMQKGRHGYAEKRNKTADRKEEAVRERKDSQRKHFKDEIWNIPGRDYLEKRVGNVFP